jgi:hypothetical protein
MNRMRFVAHLYYGSVTIASLIVSRIIRYSGGHNVLKRELLPLEVITKPGGDFFTIVF